MRNKTGYVDSIPYIHKWTSACKPYEIDINLKFHGAASRLAAQDIRVIDLGCGSGATLLMLAESMPDAEFVGIDFNAEHIEWANQFARRSNLRNVEFKQEAFATTLQKKYGSFDLVLCQGVYSWVSDTVRREALECINRLAAADAALQISWNTEAGYTQLIPLRSTLREIVKMDDGDHAEAWSNMFGLIQTLESMEVPWFDKNPLGHDRINSWKKSDPRYLVHEYLNESWHLTNFNQISNALSHYGFRFSGYSFFERWQLNNPDVAFDETHAGLEELITELAMCVAHRNDTFVRGQQSPHSLDMETLCVACSQPADLVSVQVIANQTKNSTGIMYQCLDGAKTVAELTEKCGVDDRLSLITKIRDEISRGMILRVDPDVASMSKIHANAGVKMEYSSAFSRNLVNDSKLLTELSCFPSRVTRGGVRIPPTIALLVDVFCRSDDEQQWFMESQKRLAECGITIAEGELRSTMQCCVDSWIPYMLFHNVLQV